MTDDKSSKPSSAKIPKSWRANYAKWNKFPVLDFNQCLMLLLGLNPDKQIPRHAGRIRDRYDHLRKLMQSCRTAGTLVGTSPYSIDIEPSKFIEWAKSMGEPIPEDWKPIGAGQAKVEQAIFEADADKIEIVEPIEKQIPDQEHKNEKDSSTIESKIAEDLYNRMSDDPTISDIGGGTMMFDYLTNAGTLNLIDGTEYFLGTSERSQSDRRKDVGKRKYGDEMITYTSAEKLQKIGFRKLVDAFTLRKKQ